MFYFFPRVIFQVFWSKSRVLGQIGRSGKVLGFISSDFGPDPTAGYLLKGNNRGAIIIIIIPDNDMCICIYNVTILIFTAVHIIDAVMQARIFYFSISA